MFLFIDEQKKTLTYRNLLYFFTVSYDFSENSTCDHTINGEKVLNAR